MKLWAWVLVASVSIPATASAYRTLSEEPEFVKANGQAIGWTRWPIQLEVYSQPQDLLDGAATFAALQEAVAVWDQSSCASAAMVARGMTDAPARLGDGRNTVQWVHSGWAAVGPPDAVAITQNRYQVKVGQYTLIEADVYLNAATMQSWSSEMLGHLDGVLAHELGHVIGLAHPCEINGENGAPRCSSQPMSLMHPQYDPRAFALSADDDDGACYLYPDAAPRTEVSAESACSVSRIGARSAPAVWLGVLALGALAWARRRFARAHAAQS